MTVASDDDLDIRSGGVVAVDTETLRAAAARLIAEGAQCDDLRASLDQARRIVQAEGVWFVPPAGAAAQAGERSRRLAGDLQTMADTYEVAELVSAAAVADAAGDGDLASDLRQRAQGIVAADPFVAAKLTALVARWQSQTRIGLTEQYTPPLLPGMGAPVNVAALALFATSLIGIAGRGTVSQGTRLGGPADPVAITRNGVGRTSAPMSLTQVVDRIPQGENRVRVERYTMPNGSRQFMVYAAGTADDEREAWDWPANIDLYADHERAASFEATMAAVADAGAQPGDTVNLAGYSQGGLVASFVALDGTYDVPLLITFGDPVQADVGSDTLSVALRHDDDPVSALANGGFAAGVGADGSFVASRDTPGTAWTGEGPIGSHQLDAYRETAGMLDGSTDPRMDAVRERWQALSQATSVEAFVYGAARVPAEIDPLKVPAISGAWPTPAPAPAPGVPQVPAASGVVGSATGVSRGGSADAG